MCAQGVTPGVCAAPPCPTPSGASPALRSGVLGRAVAFCPFGEFNQRTTEPDLASRRHGGSFSQLLTSLWTPTPSGPPKPFWPPLLLSLYFSLGLPPLFGLSAGSSLQGSEDEELTACCRMLVFWLGRIPSFFSPLGSMSVPLPAGRRWRTCTRRLWAAPARRPCGCGRRRTVARALWNASCARSIDLRCIQTRSSKSA